jgi:hypothetical protein
LVTVITTVDVEDNGLVLHLLLVSVHSNQHQKHGVFVDVIITGQQAVAHQAKIVTLISIISAVQAAQWVVRVSFESHLCNNDKYV